MLDCFVPCNDGYMHRYCEFPIKMILNDKQNCY